MALRQIVGSDIAQDKFDAHISILTEDFEKKCLGRKTFNNNAKGFEQLNKWVEKYKDKSVEEGYTMEFTGVYYEMLAHYLKVTGKNVFVVIPSKAKKYAASLSHASKTDRLDAQSLAWMGLERKLKKWDPVSDIFMDMRSLTREREELIKEQTMVKNKLHALKNKSLQNFSIL